jgi:hypothetical protein
VRFRLLPRHKEFYDLFVEVATRSAEASRLLRKLLIGNPGSST